MAGRRRKWLITAVVLVLVAALGWALFGRAGKMEVQLVFVGYTNYFASFTNAASRQPVRTRNVFSAIVMATNSGDVAVELYATSPLVLRSISDNFAVPIEMKFPRILKPTETLVIQVEPQRLGVPWYTDLTAQRRGLLDRLYVKAKTKGSSATKRILTGCLSPPPHVLATLGPVTNALDKHPIREWIEPYTPPRPAHDLFDDEP